jgi:tetratricopeptide (TPR) repeat protein
MEMQFTPVEVFYSFAQADAPLVEQLEKHLSVLRREGIISTWHKRQIAAGSDWQMEIDRHLNTASLILLLISPDFLASDYQYGVELQRAMERHNANDACVIPILLRPCEWEGTPFGKLQAIPRNGTPLTLWRNRDAGFTEVTKEIRATLPSLSLSAPTTKHSLWNVPHQRNPYFTGRNDLFNRIDQYLVPTGQATSVESRRVALTQPYAIKGLGGIGKTQIAVEYAYRSRDLGRYTHTLWVNAASEERMIDSFVSIAKLIPSLVARHETDQHKQVEAVKHWLEQCKERWLLIFDNADEVALVRGYLPNPGNGSILLTTRAYAVGSLATSVEVETMGFIEGTELLLRRAQRFEHATDEEINQAGNIVVALDHFPLALDQAGAYIEEKQCSFADYLALYQTHRQALLAQRGEQVIHYPDSVATTWSLSFQKVQQANPAAAELLQLCSFLAPDRIPFELLKDGAAYWPASLQQAVTDPVLFQELISELLKFSLVKRLVEDQAINIHRLVQAVQIDRMEREMQRRWAERAVFGVNTVFPSNPQETAQWEQCQKFLSQVQQCGVLIEQYKLQFVETADLLNRAYLYFSEQALYDIAGLLLQQSFAIYKQLDSTPLDIAIGFHNFATHYLELGQYTQAEPLYQRAITIFEQQLGPEHPVATMSLSGLAELYSRQARYTEAESLYHGVLRVQMNAPELGPEDPTTLNSLSGLAELYYKQGRYTEAEPLCQHVLAIKERVLGSGHLDVASSLDRLADLHLAQGRCTEVEPLYQRALAIKQRVLGPEHPKVASSLDSLAIFYRTLDNREKTEPLYQRALAIREKFFGPEHPETAASLNNLANLYRTQGKYKEAELLHLRALAIDEKTLGSEHPTTATDLNNLAELYQLQGRYKEAESLHLRALMISEKGSGAEHPDTATSLNNLAQFYKAQKRYDEAESLYLHALATDEKISGPEHLGTAQTLHNLADLYHLQGKYKQAKALYERALAVRERILGPHHPRTRVIYKNYQRLLREMSEE